MGSQEAEHISDQTMSGQTGRRQIEDERVGHSSSDGYSDSGVIRQALVGAARLDPVPRASVAALLVAGVVTIDGTVAGPLLSVEASTFRQNQASDLPSERERWSGDETAVRHRR